MIRKIIIRYEVCTIAVIAASIAALSHPATAETVGAVTQTAYNYIGQPVCVAVRMNPSAYGSLPASACDLGAQGSEGPDRITKTSYDNSGQVKHVRQAVGTPIERAYSTFAYSPNGKVTDSIDANGNRTKMAYDGFDRLSAVYYPDTNRPGGWNPATPATALATAGSYSGSDYEAYGYDDNGNRTWWRRRDGNYINYNYDSLNREILHYSPNGLIPHLYTTYDLTGKVLKKRFNDWNGPGVTYTYDGLGRLDTATDMNGRSLDYNYNQASARTGMLWPDGKQSNFDLDSLNRLTGSYISNSDVAMWQNYDDLGRLVGRGRINNTGTGWGYDNQGRLTNLNYYFPDGSKNIYWGFAYNPANQITTLYANNTTQYDYRETQTQTDNRAFDGLNRDAGIAALSGGYDARGNMTNDGSRQMTYDLYNRLTALTGNGQNLQMTYDPEGRLASYTVNGATTTFLYDGVKLIAEYDGSGNMQKRYLHGIGTDDPWAELTGSDVNSANVKYLYANYQGSIFAQANGSGTVTDIYKYGPYGEPKNAADQTSFSGSRFRYTGQTVLPEAQLYYYKARVYDPIHGRFLQTDPIGSKDDLNLYAYVGGDPINNFDPQGTDAWNVTSRIMPGVYHTYTVVADKLGGPVTERFSYGPDDESHILMGGKLVSLTGSGETADVVDAANWKLLQNPEEAAKQGVYASRIDAEDRNVIAAGRAIDAYLGTPDAQGNVPYTAVPSKDGDAMNSNTATGALTALAAILSIAGGDRRESNTTLTPGWHPGEERAGDLLRKILNGEK